MGGQGRGGEGTGLSCLGGGQRGATPTPVGRGTCGPSWLGAHPSLLCPARISPSLASFTSEWPSSCYGSLVLTAACLLASAHPETGLGRPSFLVGWPVRWHGVCVCVYNIKDTWDLYHCRKTGIHAEAFWKRKDQDSHSFCIRCEGMKNFWNVCMIKTQWQCSETDCGDACTFLWLYQKPLNSTF